MGHRSALLAHSLIMAGVEEEEQINYIDLANATVKRYGGDIPGEIATWFYKSFPVQSLVWVRENTRACYYFENKNGFLWKDNKEIIGFKTHSKTHPINAQKERGAVTSVTLPTNRLCAVLKGNTVLSIKDLDISNSYATVVVTLKFSNKVLSTKQQVYGNWHRALTAYGSEFMIYGAGDGGQERETKIKPPHGFDEWITIWIQWGTVNYPTSHVYLITENVSVDKSFIASPKIEQRQLFVGALPDGSEGFVGSIAALEVYTSTERFLSNDLRKNIIEDHQRIVRKM